MYYFHNITTTLLAQLDKCWFAKQEVTGSNLGWANTQGLEITDLSSVVQPFMGRVGNEGVDIKLDAGPFSSPVTVLSHCGEFNKVSIKYMLEKRRIPQSFVFLQTL